jgi:hypothetical protein
VNILTIIELDNSEVEQILDASFVYVDETVYENVIHTCVDGFIANKTNKHLETDDAMEQLFAMLKARHIIPSTVEDFSYELTSCERIKTNNQEKNELPKKIALSFTQSK